MMMVTVRGNWEFGENEDRLTPVPKRNGNELKKSLASADELVLAKVKTTLDFVGRPNLQGQSRAAHILIRYDPSYIKFSAADHISIPRGEQHLVASCSQVSQTLGILDLKSLRPASKVATTKIGPNKALIKMSSLRSKLACKA